MSRPSIPAVFAALAAMMLVALPSTAQKAGKVVMQEKGWGTLTGKVVYEGKLPKAEDPAPRMKVAGNCCFPAPASQVADPSLVVNAETKGVGNVVVLLNPPAGKVFPIHVNDRKRKSVTLDQPFCAFVPHIVTLCPAYDDGQQLVATGEKLEFKNSAKCPHNVRGVGDPRFNDDFNFNLPPGATKEVLLHAQQRPFLLECNIHPWMKAYAFIRTHPYATVTDKDGVFKFDRVPLGVEANIVTWHERRGWGPGAAIGTPVALTEATNELPAIAIKLSE